MVVTPFTLSLLSFEPIDSPNRNVNYFLFLGTRGHERGSRSFFLLLPRFFPILLFATDSQPATGLCVQTVSKYFRLIAGKCKGKGDDEAV